MGTRWPAAVRRLLVGLHAAVSVAAAVGTYRAAAAHLPALPTPGGPVPTAGFAAIAVVLAAALVPGLIIRKIRNHP